MNNPPRILYLEDDLDEAELVRNALKKNVIGSMVNIVDTRDKYLMAIQSGDMDIILSDSKVPGFDGLSAFRIAREQCPDIPFIFVSGYLDQAGIEQIEAVGATAYASKAQMPELVSAVQNALAKNRQATQDYQPSYTSSASARLIAAIQELSLAHTIEEVMSIVRNAARELTGADGATLVLREGDQCHYAEENAIGPLWKGRRFPMNACISGWTMLNGQAAVIEDVYNDARVPVDAYRPTFVKSLAMIPIRPAAAIGAIGNYWANHHRATPEELNLLQALADSTSIALENIRLYSELEQRVSERTAQLEATNKELEAFSFAVFHDLRAPLRHMQGFSNILLEDCSDQLGEEGREYLQRLKRSVHHMEQLIEDLLTLSRMSHVPVRREQVNLSVIAREIISELRSLPPQRHLDFVLPEDIFVSGDPGLMHALLQNLISNAWKFTSKREHARIEFGRAEDANEGTYYYLRDNGMGFDMAYAGKLFTPFQRLHSSAEMPGTGVGLAIVQRIIHKHGGRIWAEAKPDKGACFYFTLAK